MSTAGLAMRNQVNANQLRRWVVVHGRRAGALPPAMLPVTVLAGVPHPVAQAPAPRALIELEFCQATVRVHAGADATALRMVLDVLRGVTR